MNWIDRFIEKHDMKIINFWIFVLCVFYIVIFASAVNADELPITRITDSPDYATVQDAACAALDRIAHPLSENEFGGAIVLHDGKYFYTEAVSTSDENGLDFRIQMHRGDKLVGMYHTHPAESNYTYSQLTRLAAFSIGDIVIARKLNVLSYMLDGYTMDIHVYDPTRINRTTVTSGEIVATLSKLTVSK
jgi:hypothetical protein